MIDKNNSTFVDGSGVTKKKFAKFEMESIAIDSNNKLLFTADIRYTNDYAYSLLNNSQLTYYNGLTPGQQTAYLNTRAQADSVYDLTFKPSGGTSYVNFTLANRPTN